jgi:hypothetical protein
MNDKNHKTVTADSEYDVTFHPGFASECTITRKGENTARQLYKQTEQHNCGSEGHPKKHVIKLKGKNGKKRDITITIDDPEHSVHSLSLELYDESRDPNYIETFNPGVTETFTVMNTADTCPPNCKPTGE